MSVTSMIWSSDISITSFRSIFRFCVHHNDIYMNFHYNRYLFNIQVSKFIRNELHSLRECDYFLFLVSLFYFQTEVRNSASRHCFSFPLRNPGHMPRIIFSYRNGSVILYIYERSIYHENSRIIRY